MSFRIKKINELIKRILSEVLEKKIEIEKDVLVTITRIETDKGINSSKVYLSVIPENKTEKTILFLNKILWLLEKELAQKLKIKKIPKLILKEDQEFKKMERIEKILDELKAKKQ